MRARRICALVLWGVFSTGLMAGCNGLLGNGGGGGSASTGGIVAQVTGPSGKGLSLPAGGKASLMPTVSDVETVHVIVSAADISPSIKQDFSPGAADASIPDVPVGSDRTLTVQALDAGGKALFTGEATGITVVAGEVTDVGTILLSICSGSKPEQAQCLVEQGKASLEELASSDTAVSFAEAMDGIVAWFAAALKLNPQNEEAAFYLALFQMPSFADSQATTGILGNLGLGSVRVEDQKADPFAPADNLILGGTDDYVALGFADLYGYLFEDLPGSFGDGVDLLDGLGPSFTSTLTLPDPEGAPRALEFDYTDAKVLEAIAAIEQATFYSATPWNYPGVDSFISASSDRDPATGAFTDEITPAEVESYLAGSPAPLSLNQAGVDKANGALAKAFATLAEAMDSLLNNESDDQSNDFFVMSEDNPEFDGKPEVNQFLATLLIESAQNLSASFASSAPVSVEIPQAIGFITDFGTCNPRAAEATDPSPFNEPGDNPGTATGLNALDVTTNINDPAGVDPPTAAPDGIYYFTFTVDASAGGGVNLSMFTRNTTSNTNYSFGKLSYSTDGTTFINWDSDFSGGGAEDNFGLSVSKDMFDPTSTDPNLLPQSPTLTFLVGVESYGPSSGAFKFYVWDDTVAGVPIFLKGNGRNYAVKVYRVVEQVSLANVFQVLGGIPDLSDRSSFDAVNHNLTMTTADVEDAILSVLPAANGAITITHPDGSAVGITMDFIQDHVNVNVPLPRTDVTGEYPAAPSSFCAYPWQLNTHDQFEGGFDL